MEENITYTSIDTVIQKLLDNSKLFPENLLSNFSDISLSDLAEIKKIWPKVTLERKISLLDDLENLLLIDTKLSFEEFAVFVIGDDFPEVRANAIPLLWECENPNLIRLLIKLLENDESELVKIAAAAGLGQFVRLGELDEIPHSAFKRTVEALLNKINSNPSKELHQEILKSLSYSSMPEVAPMITAAFNNTDRSWLSTALIAMGRTSDDQWKKQVVKMIESEDPDFKKEAVRAAGELELSSVQTLLLNMLEDENDDPELRLVIIWALSRIGGDNVKSSLRQLLEESRNEEEIEAIELALEDLDFISGLPKIDL